MSSTQYFICIFLLLTGVSSASAKGWRGIEPLHSTRADVERLLGPPQFIWSPYSTGYDFPEGRALISYASGVCTEGLPGGWKVPKDTVLEIQVSLASEQKLADMLVPGKKYEEIRAAHTQHIYYVDYEEGISFTVWEDIVQSISYGPTEKDKGALCSEYKYAVPVAPGVKLKGVDNPTFDRFSNIRFEDAKARLDNFVIQLFHLKAQDSGWRGYIIVYAGRRSYTGEAQHRANCFKHYLVRVRHMDAASLFAVDGGFREQMEVELYVGHSDFYPPVLQPTVSPGKVTVIRRRFKNCADRGL